MQKGIYSQELKTVCNAVIQIGDIDDTGKGRHFVSRFIQDGLVKIEGHGIVLLKKETIDQSLQSMVGAPVIIKHQDVTNENADELRCGVISKAYFNDFDGWYYCEGIIWDEKAKELINKGWSVSCSYDFLAYNDEGGVENNIKYDKEFTQLNFTHLAIVNNPRYERANIVFNSKDDENGRWVTIKGTHVFIPDGKSVDDVMKEKGWEQKGEDEKSDTSPTQQSDVEKTYKVGSKFVQEDLYGKKEHTVKEITKDLYGDIVVVDETGYQHHPNQIKPIQEDKQSDSKDGKSDTSSKRSMDDVDDTEITKYINKIGEPQSIEQIGEALGLDPSQYKAGEGKASRLEFRLLSMQRYGQSVLKVDDKFITKKMAKAQKEYMQGKKQNKANNSKEQDMLLDEIKKLIKRVENNKETEEMVENEKVDKRKLIDEVGGILKDKVDEEVWRTIIGKLEKMSYNESEAGTADNKKVKNEDEEEDKKVDNEDEEDEKEVKEVKEEVKEDVDNKCKNSKSSFDKINEIYNSVKQVAQESTYVTRQEKLDNAVEYFK